MTAPTAWCTPDDVTNFCPGVTATQAQVNAAQFIIDLVSNRTIASSGQFRPRDQEWLRRAVAYQTAWMSSHPDVFARMMNKGISQDGVTAMFVNKHDVYLAPLAARALKNVRWLRTRSLRPQIPVVDEQVITDDEDLYLFWQDLGSF